MQTENNEFRIYTFSYVCDWTQRQKSIKFMMKQYINMHYKEVYEAVFIPKLNIILKKLGKQKLHM